MSPEDFLIFMSAMGAKAAGIFEERQRWIEPLKDDAGPVRVEAGGRRYWIDRDRSEPWEEDECVSFEMNRPDNE